MSDMAVWWKLNQNVLKVGMSVACPCHVLVRILLGVVESMEHSNRHIVLGEVQRVVYFFLQPLDGQIAVIGYKDEW